MKRGEITRPAKKGLALLMVVLAVMLPLAAFAQAETDDAAAAADTAASAAMPGQQGNGMGGFGNQTGTLYMDTSALTDEQKAAYDQALALYEGVEDAVLADLVTASVVTQADVDAYKALREAQKEATSLDQSAWTADDYKTYYEANAKTGDERKEAMQALADAGLITQAQADALGAQGQDDLWSTINRNADTNTAIQTALTTMKQARQTMQEALQSAGITGMGNGNMPAGGAGMGGQPAMKQDGNDNGNTPSDSMPQGGPSQGGGQGGRNQK